MCEADQGVNATNASPGANGVFPYNPPRPAVLRTRAGGQSHPSLFKAATAQTSYLIYYVGTFI